MVGGWRGLVVVGDNGIHSDRINGPRFLEGVPKQSCMRLADDAATALQEFLSRRVDRVMLYSENLPDRFFDLSSGEAGCDPAHVS